MRRLTFLLITLLIASFGSFAQKRFSILGDSYSTFKGYVEPDTNFVWYPIRGNDVIKVEETWWHQFANDYGYQLEVNKSFSGATISNTGYRKEDYIDRSFVTRLNKLGNPDIIFIFGGTNDTWAKVPIGEYQYANWTSTDLYAYRPALACLLNGLQVFYPSAKIYFILNSELTDDINESSLTICAHYDVPCIVLHDIDKQRNHPSVAGMKAISRQVYDFINR